MNGSVTSYGVLLQQTLNSYDDYKRSGSSMRSYRCVSRFTV